MNATLPSASGNPSPKGDRVIRVFISSTFRDMQAERELLVKQVFPELRRVCAERFVTFTEVDLRWGITEEQAAEGKVLPICLEEIHRSRPYFIGLLGGRYGWIPDSVPPEVMAREPWLQEHVGGRTSVTELEILHGVLNNPAMDDHAFFYFRDPGYVDTLPETERLEMVERNIPADVETHGAAEATRRTAERRAKLAALKGRIRCSGKPLVEPYANPQALADAVRQQFLNLIDQLYPKDEIPDAITREARGHAAYAAGKLLAYVERPAHTAAIDAFVAAEPTGQGLVLTGPSGGGKTALLAAWMRHWRQGHPDEFAFEHYFGDTPESATVSGFLVRLLGELKSRYAITKDIPTDSAKLREILPLWLAQAAGRDRIVLVFDALNQIEGDEADRRLVWLPRHFPPQVRVIASALPGPSLDALTERDWTKHPLPLPDEEERDAMIAAFLDHYRKTLQPDLRRQIATAPGAANPLFLRTVLEELRQFGSFERLPAEVARYLKATTPEALFRLVLQRWQQDFDAGYDLVRRALRHLWAARQGLAETEWLELLATATPLPRQVWTPFFYALEPHLARHAGLFAFGHDFLRQAVRAEFLDDDADIRAAHRALADYFEPQPPTPRTATELPWQLREAGERDRLRACLLAIDQFLLIRKRDQNELLRYWVWLGEERSMGKAYREAFELWSRLPGNREQDASFVAHVLGLFLGHASLHAEAKPLMRRALDYLERSPGESPVDIASVLSGLVASCIETNHLAEAEKLCRRALAVDKQLLGPVHPNVARDLSSLGQVLRAANRLPEAEKMYRRAIRILKSSPNKDHASLATGLSNLAQLLLITNRPAEAERLLRQALAIDQEFLGQTHPSVARDLANLAELLRATNRSSEAEQHIRQALDIAEMNLGKDHPRIAVCLSNLSTLLLMNRPAEAAQLIRRALSIDERSYGQDHPLVAIRLNNLATVLARLNQLTDAEMKMRQALAIWQQRSLGTDDPDLAKALFNLAVLLTKTNRFKEAEQRMRRALRIMWSIEKATGHALPERAPATKFYRILLERTGRSPQEALAATQELKRRYGPSSSGPEAS